MDNTISSLRELVKNATGLSSGVNKLNELSRLVYEIARREKTSWQQVLGAPEIRAVTLKKSMGYGDRFARVKEYLMQRRYPNASRRPDFSVYFSRLAEAHAPAGRHEGSFIPETIFIEASVKDSMLARRAKNIFPSRPVVYIGRLADYRAQLTPGGDLRKRDLVITRQLWDFIKPCPCTKDVRRCGYHVINLGFGCPFDCGYCYLQHYTTSPGILVDANVEEFLPRIDEYLSRFQGRMIRIGTGEFTDSLALDHITGYSKTLVPFFASRNALLELKTKSANADNLIGLSHNQHTVISWSMNPERVVTADERGTATLEERLAAARRVSGAGYPVAFHFDPVMYYEGWETEYRSVVEKIFSAVKTAAWISVGSFRFHRSLKNIIESRFPGSDYIYGELVIGADRKMRYYEDLRVEMYRKMHGWIRECGGETPVYLCMEPDHIWEKIIEKKPWWMDNGNAGSD